MVPPLRVLFPFLSLLVLALPSVAQKDPAKGPDKEVAEKIALLKDVVGDKKFARDAEGLQAIDTLLQKSQAGLDAKDQKDIVKALEHVLTQGKARPHDKTELYVGAAQALGYCGADGAKVLQGAYLNKSRYPEKPDWVPFREHVLKNLGRTKDESMVKFLVKEARQNPEAALQASAGEALGNFEDSKDALRKEIVGELLVRYGELDEKASQIGTNIEAQNAQDRLAALQEKWNSTLAKLTRQNHSKLRDWQAWHQKNKDKPW
jgi:hypothetical protein